MVFKFNQRNDGMEYQSRPVSGEGHAILILPNDCYLIIS